MVDHTEAIENYRWGEFKAWLEAHNDLLIQHHKVEAPDSSARSVSSLVQTKTPLEGRNNGDGATSGANSPIFGRKLSPHGKK